MQSVPHLILRTELGERYLPLMDGHCWTVGRNDDNNFVLGDRWISRNHAMVQFMDTGEYYLIDLGSRNGTFLNGRRVSIPVLLSHGDHVIFGQTDLEFYAPADQREPNNSQQDVPRPELSATVALNIRRLITVLVIDIRNFTVLTRQMNEQVLSEMIGTWFRQAGEIIQQYGSGVDKYIGDAVMAVWVHGAEEVPSSEMTNVMQALIALHQMTEALQDTYPLPFPLRIGAGINTGYAMVGNAGTGARPDYTALGDTVNAAFRLETSTKQISCDVAIGEETYKYTSPLLQNGQTPFQCFSVQLKGYETPTVTYACAFEDLATLLNS